MKLVEPTTEYDQQICAYRKEFLDCGDSMDGTGALRRMDNPQVWIEHANRCKDPLTVPQGLVPATQYMLVREEDQKIVGMIQIRHFLIPIWKSTAAISVILLRQVNGEKDMQH